MDSNRLQSRPAHYFFLTARLLLGAVFLAAGVGKIFHPGEFAGIINNYQILPDDLVNLAAIVLPWIETVVGLLMLRGWWLPGAATLADLLLLVFLGALVSAAARGIDIDCGCFSVQSTASPDFTWYLGRDLFFLVLGVFVTVQTLKIGTSGKDGAPDRT